MSIKVKMAEFIYNTYLRDCEAERADRIIENVVLLKNIRMFYNNNYDVIVVKRGDNFLVNANFVKEMTLRLGDYLTFDFPDILPVEMEGHKKCLAIYAVYFSVFLLDFFYDKNQG